MTTAQRDAIRSIDPHSTVQIACLDPDGDIPDPHGEPAAEYERCAGRIRQAVGTRLTELNLLDRPAPASLVPAPGLSTP
jgi:protein-tyrosine-phosphatase